MNPPTPKSDTMRIGIDLGGTKIEGLVLDAVGTERARLRVATPQGPYEETVEAIIGVVAELEQQVGARCHVGLATPGAISPATGLSNDANCLAVSEAADGSAAGCKIVFGVILGTGVGGGITVDGLPITGAQAIA